MCEVTAALSVLCEKMANILKTGRNRGSIAGVPNPKILSAKAAEAVSAASIRKEGIVVDFA